MYVTKSDKSAQINDNEGNFVALIEQAPDHPYSYWVETSLVPVPADDYDVDTLYTFDFTATDLDAAIKHTLYLIQTELESFIDLLRDFERTLEKDIYGNQS